MLNDKQSPIDDAEIEDNLLNKPLNLRGIKVYCLVEARSLAETAGFTDVVVSTRLGPGDLLLIKPSARCKGALARLAWALYPRALIRLIGERFGLYLLIEVRKEAGAG